MFQSSNPGDSIRYFTNRDIKRAIAIGDECFLNPPNSRYFKDLLNRDESIGWVVERDGVVVAYCWVQITERVRSLTTTITPQRTTYKTVIASVQGADLDMDQRRLLALDRQARKVAAQ